jgi:hypothetical protein
MIRHIVLFKMKEGLGPDDAKKLAAALFALKAKTDGHMVECETALDVVHAGNSYDVVLNSAFKDLDELGKYQVHPEHKKVLELIKEVCASTGKIDYQI